MALNTSSEVRPATRPPVAHWTATESDEGSTGRRLAIFASASLLLLVLVWGGPLFICEPFWMEPIHYDLIAQQLLAGRVIYRDVIDTNLPGIVWIHASVRGLLGWRSEVLRGFDLLMLLTTSLLLMRLACRGTLHLQLFGIALTLLYYFSTPAIVHCQRDTWMLLPCALAVLLRAHALSQEDLSRGRELLGILAEGLAWGAAVWIKPHIVVPAIATWLAAAYVRREHDERSWASLAADSAVVVLGGLLAGAVGCLILIASGSWPYFFDTLFTWSVSYLHNGARGSVRLGTCLAWLFYNLPWSLVHFVALPLAVRRLLHLIRVYDLDSETPQGRRQFLLAVFYLSWLVQAFVVQLTHEYVIATTVLVAIPLLVVELSQLKLGLAGRLLATVFIAAALALHPQMSPQALELWPRCVTSGSSPAVKDELAVQSQRFGLGHSHWQDLARVEDFLRAQGVQDGELSCWDDMSQQLFLRLRIAPSTRFMHASMWLGLFPNRRETIVEEFQDANARFVVNDLVVAGFPRDEVEAMPEEEMLPPDLSAEERQVFPWNQPVVFRAGRFVVHEVR